LQEARAALFDPIPAPNNVARGLIRTYTAAFRGAPVTCVLLSGAPPAATAPPGRRWEETEECIDPNSGLLQVHSQIPGRYAAFDYANGARLGTKVLPGQIVISEAGRTVSTISLESLTVLSSSDSSLFVPTAEMKARGPAIAMAAARKMSRVPGQSPVTSGVTIRPVCVFGVAPSLGLEVHLLVDVPQHEPAANRCQFHRALRAIRGRVDPAVVGLARV
jgi:hypothetical protein